MVARSRAFAHDPRNSWLATEIGSTCMMMDRYDEAQTWAQRALTRLGYDTQGVDGVIGTNTRAALRRWQIANGRIADGYLTAALADELIRKAG